MSNGGRPFVGVAPTGMIVASTCYQYGKGCEMRIEELVLVSVDDHVVEPPTVFDNQLPARLLSQAPRVTRRADGSDVWVFEGIEVPNIGLNAVAGRPREEYGLDPTSFEEMRKGCWDIDHAYRRHERERCFGFDVLSLLSANLRSTILSSKGQGFRPDAAAGV